MGKKALFIVLGILLIGLIVGMIIYSNSTKQSIIPSMKEELNFCSNIEECINYLKLQGMPDNFLEENNINILCEEGSCYVK